MNGDKIMGIIIGGSKNGLTIKETNRLQVVSMVINNSCNLKCKHCYLQSTQKQNSVLMEDEWICIAESLLTYSAPSTIAFVGKEPLINYQSANLVSNIIKIRNTIQKGRHNRTSIGLLTNGMSLLQFSDILLTNPPDYIDISVDGLPTEHDFLRGKGTFSKLEPNLRWATENFPEPLWLTPTLNRNNIDSFLNMIRYYNNHFDIRRFAFGFYIPGNNVNDDLSVLPDQIEKLVNRDLYKLAELSINEPVEILFDLYPNHSDSLQSFNDSGWAPSNGGIESSIYDFPNGVSMKIHTTKVAVGLRYSVRITPEGYWLAAEDAIRMNEYKKLAVANIRDFQYDATELYETGLNSARFYKLCREHKSKLQKTPVLKERRNVALA